MLRFLTAGESHGQALVAILEGMPAGLTIDFDAVTTELRRRQGGYGRGRRMAIESDRAKALSGIRHGRTTGSPIALLIPNNRLFIVPGGGHLFMLYSIDKVVPVVRGFLESELPLAA